jgi:hypothetical protein
LCNAIPIGIALLISKAQVILEIGGAFGGCLIDFVFPGILFVKNSDNHWYDCKKLLAIVLTTIGVIGWITCMCLAIWEAVITFELIPESQVIMIVNP